MARPWGRILYGLVGSERKYEDGPGAPQGSRGRFHRYSGKGEGLEARQAASMTLVFHYRTLWKADWRYCRQFGTWAWILSLGSTSKPTYALI